MKKIEKKRNRANFLELIRNHVENNLKQYFIISILFIIGVAIGVTLANHVQFQAQEQVGNSITEAINKLKEGYEINYSSLLKNVILNHILFTLILWFLGCSVIGIPIVYLAIGYKGISLGYTISSIILTLGTGKGILFAFIALLLQNLFIIPAILAIAVSSMNLYSSIIKNKRIENIKIEIIRHTIFCFGMSVILIVASFIEVYATSFLLKICATNLL